MGIIGSFKHAIMMVKKNKRKYMLLSVTILISFVFFLAYLMYIDSNYMTKNVQDIVSSKKLIRVCASNVEEQRKLKVFLDSIDNKETHYYINREVFLHEDYIDLFAKVDKKEFDMGVNVIPSECSNVFNGIYMKINSREDKGISLGKDEIIVPEYIYKELYKNKQETEDVYIKLPFALKDDKCIIKDLKVVGAYRVNKTVWMMDYSNRMIISYETVRNNEIKLGDNIQAYIYTEKSQDLIRSMRSMELPGISTLEQKSNAFSLIKEKVRVKAIITVVLFFLLGINLYSSFKNVLEQRKYEIGVKRAVGASGLDIIEQFFFEGIIVVGINVILAIFITNMMFLVYKLYNEIVLGQEFIIYINNFSKMMFGVVSMFIMFIYSITFAIQSSRVEIIKYLKSE